jgi:hypothetical protein
MRNKNIQLVIIICLLLFVQSCNRKSPAEVRFDERIELFWAVFILTPSGGQHQKEFIYPYRSAGTVLDFVTVSVGERGVGGRPSSK